jgi:hypothetical protein
MGTEEEKFKDGFRGIAITGWQRYDHFAVLAELLPGEKLGKLFLPVIYRFS